MTTVRLEKFEAIGNDFLISIDAGPIGPELVVALCDRHFGIGADGFIAIDRRAAAVFGFSLRNADGSVAETSGNGLRCAALAARRAGAPSELVLETDAGPVEAHVVAGADGRALVTVTMPIAAVEANVSSPLAGWSAARVNVGNPHLVLFGADAASVDLVALGESENARTDGGVNVELVEVISPERLSMRVFERGVGLTLACGSGSIAAAAALHAAAVTGADVDVDNPGGTLGVVLEPLGNATFAPRLTGPARHVATIEVDLDDVRAAALEQVPS
jgi:diaminopimelate epimerase